MTEGIGKALASAIKDDRPGDAERGGGNLFSNRHRRDIFSALSLAPCTGVQALSTSCGISKNSAKWHLDALSDKGFVACQRLGRSIVHYPDGLIDAGEAALFHSINRPGHAELLRLIIRQPGLSQAEASVALGMGRQKIAGALTRLCEAGVVSGVHDGARVRHYPTRLLPDRAEARYKHSKQFSDYFIKRLADEGGPPTVIRRDLDSILVEGGRASERFTMRVGINPYLTCVACD